MLICPNCKLLYEKSTNCIRCGSPLVEKTSSEKEGIKAPSQPEIKKDLPPIQKPAPPPIPTPKDKDKNDETEIESISDMEKALHEVLTDGQSPSDIFPTETKREVSRPEKIQIRIPSLTYQKISMIILILIGGYLLWSIYSYFMTKTPGTNAPPSKETVSLLPSRPSTPTKPLAPVIEPKVTNNKKLEKNPSVSEKETAVSPSTPSLPIASKTPLSNEKEIENIKNLFESIRQANLQKNIDLFISCYSATFKDRGVKKRETLKNWENFTYTNLSYNLKKHSISGDTAVVRVEWLIRFSPKAGSQPQESKTVLDVTLNRDPGGWKIKEIKLIS